MTSNRDATHTKPGHLSGSSSEVVILPTASIEALNGRLSEGQDLPRATHDSGRIASRPDAGGAAGSAEKGREDLDSVTYRVSRFVVELSRSEVDDMCPMKQFQEP